MAKILLVEDDDDIRQIEADYLHSHHFEIVEARNGEQALELFSHSKIDLVILDLNLPLMDGISVCRMIRKDSGVPIIMVTARTGEIDELLGLEIGADDYLKKPFSPKVLVARVKALLKRPELATSPTKLVHQSLVMDLESRTLTKGKQIVNVTATQFNLLYHLMSRPGKVFSREDLIDRGYGKDLPPDIFDRTIDSHIKNLRKQIEDNPEKPKKILTVRGHGYKFSL